MDLLSPVGCKVNMEYYRNMRYKYFEQALEALAQEKKWEERLKAQNNFEETVKTVD